jgi:hypothetical protein
MVALKQMADRNPEPTLIFAKKFLNHPNPEIRRVVLHGIETQGKNPSRRISASFKKFTV